MEKLYTKEINGEVKILPKQKIVIYGDNIQTFDPSEEMLLEDGWSVYEEPVYEPLKETVLTLDDVKRRKVNEIKMYDKTSEVNRFYLNNNVLWFNKTERLNLKFRLDAEKLAGKEVTTFWYKDESYQLPVDTALKIINELEIYASECFDITKTHCQQIESLESEDLVNSYEYKNSYPKILSYEY